MNSFAEHRGAAGHRGRDILRDGNGYVARECGNNRPDRGCLRVHAGALAFMGSGRQQVHQGQEHTRADEGEVHITFHFTIVSSSGPSPIRMKVRSREIAEIATIEPTNLSFRPEKSTVPIQAGRSAWPSASILETKFS